MSVSAHVAHLPHTQISRNDGLNAEAWRGNFKILVDAIELLDVNRSCWNDNGVWHEDCVFTSASNSLAERSERRCAMSHSEQTRVKWMMGELLLAIVLSLLLAMLLVTQLSGAAPMPRPEPTYIVSPWDGTFYAGEYAGAQPYVHVGSTIAPDTVVCVIEAMRPFPLRAGVEGTIRSVLVMDGEMVAAGQPLFLVDSPAIPIPTRP
jgi:biotin carboxyl carrier protein